MKKILSILLALALMLGATFALAEGNVTIAVQGMNDFNDYIQSMVVYGDRLLLSSWDRLYTWDNATRKLTEVDGYSELESTLTGDDENPGVLDLNDGDYAYLDGNLYIVGGRLYRMATVTDSDGNASNQLVELLIADDGALSLGEVIDLGDALCITESDGDQTYSYTRSLSNPCSFGNTLYALSYGDELELLALLLDAGNGEAARQLAADHLDWLDEYDAALADRADIVAHNEALPSVRRRNLLDGIAFLRALAALAQRTVGEALAFANAAEGEAVAV